MQVNTQEARIANGMAAAGPKAGQASYRSLAEMQSSLISQGRQFTKEYTAKFAGTGRISVDEVKAQLQQEFPRYAFTTSNPRDVVQGQNLLHIDQNNLQKMADDPSYRARVMGLIKREASSLDGANVQFQGKTVQLQLTGTVVSISDDNPVVDGIPYAGSATSASTSTSTSTGSSARTSSGNTSRPTLRELLEEIAEKRAEERREQERREQATEQKQAAASDRVDVLA